MLLQVHDELIFEVEDADVERTTPISSRSWKMPPCRPLDMRRAAESRRARRQQLGRGSLKVSVSQRETPTRHP
jgi:hypothetical protein